MADTCSAKKCKIMLIGGHSRLNSIDSITISTDGNLLDKSNNYEVLIVGICAMPSLSSLLFTYFLVALLCCDFVPPPLSHVQVFAVEITTVFNCFC